ncbi:MAG: hypothetical protein QOK15_1826 [Nocardioidaceae bacterium]|nr:hypothetical protein [Nocardioidaceae bacterium]
MRTELLTRWGRALDADRVLPEHPRPQLVRDGPWLNLNGRWRYAVTPAGAAEPVRYDGDILVPFSPEATLSGVGRQLRPDELLWYSRTFTLPSALLTAGRLLLHFGAVDQSCTVWMNGVEVARNASGYLPFSCDITSVLRDGPNTLTLRVTDLSDRRGPSSGKQRLDRGGIWYTASSGIWQTVWVEPVPPAYVAGLVLTPLLDPAALEVTVHVDGPTSGPAHVTVRSEGTHVASAEVPVGQPTRLPLPGVRVWSPEDPFLYDVEVRYADDEVRSYVGMRTFGTGLDEEGLPRLLLNGRPYLHVGVLDQGYWPDGLMTAPSDEAMVHDITTMKRLGFTMLRKHMKVEPLRWYFHCDRIGMLVWQDLVNGGGRYLDPVISWPGRRRGRRLRLPDNRYALFGRRDPEGRRVFRAELRRTVALLRNVTSLAVWVPFNEGWGQFAAAEVTAELRALDPTRSIDHASGWHDQRAGDLWSRHVYQRPFEVPARAPEERRVLVLSECGGYGLVVPGHTWSSRHHGYGHVGTSEELMTAFVELHRGQIAPAVRRGLSGTVYTQLADVEDEVNGLLTYDREVLKLPEEVVRSVLTSLARGSGSM